MHAVAGKTISQPLIKTSFSFAALNEQAFLNCHFRTVQFCMIWRFLFVLVAKSAEFEFQSKESSFKKFFSYKFILALFFY